MHRRGRVAAAVSLVLLSLAVAWSADAPDSKTNPQSSYIETVDSTPVSGVYHIRHTITRPGGLPPIVTQLTANASDNNGPRLAIPASGDAWVTWWRSASPNQVFVRTRAYGGTSWSTELQISASSEASRNARIAHDGTTAWVAYEIPGASSTGVAVCGGDDGMGPWPPRTIVGSTSYSGILDTMILAESSKLWVTWVDSSSNVAWVQYDYATQAWSSPATESYANDSVAAARSRIRSTVLGL